MGMDVFGKNPKTPEGKYFRANIWWWHPLAEYACSIAPDLCGKSEWHSNSGDGLEEPDSVQLADRLQAELDAGRTKSYARIYQSEQEAAPNEPCFICEGTGTRRPGAECGAGDLKNGIKCNACAGTGYREAWIRNHPFSVELVRKFATFLRASGGFEIW